MNLDAAQSLPHPHAIRAADRSLKNDGRADIIEHVGHSPAAASRITIVLHDFSAGGTEHVALRLANAWAALGRTVTIFCGTETGRLRGAVEPDVAVVRAPREYVRGPRSRRHLGTALAHFLSMRPQDIVFAPGNFHLPVLARCIQLGTSGALTVCKISNPLAGRSPNPVLRSIHDAALRRMASRIDAFVAMSPALRDEARKVLGNAEIGVAWEPIIPDEVPLLPAPIARVSKPLVIAIGRLARQKNFDLAIEAFARSNASKTGELLVLGEGEERKALTRCAAKLGIADRVGMPGYSQTALAELAQASAFLLTSRFEGYPAALVEAIAAGIPVIVTPCSPAIAEIVAEWPSSIIVPADAAAIGAAIDASIKHGRPSNDGAAQLLRARHRIVSAAAGYLSMLDGLRGRCARMVGTVPHVGPTIASDRSRAVERR